MAVSIPRDETPRLRRRLALGRIAFATIAALGLGGLVAVVPSAPAAAVSNSQLTIKWDGDTSSAREFQPDRDPANGHYNEMKNISVTVSQTTDIIDQAIRVEVSGFAGTRRSAADAVVHGQNFMQAMQCWGADPNAADFVQTCQWGGRLPTVLGNSVYFDVSNRVSAKDYDPYRPTADDNPFVTVSGQRVSGKASLVDGKTFSPILSYFGPTTTNEVPAARVGSDGTGYFDFEAQSSSQSPQLGCGTAGKLRCWLIIVPRGTKFGGNGSDCSDYVDRRGEYLTKWQTTPTQAGSPVNPKCDYFDNRIVVPLDFTPTGVTCPVGGTEFRVAGSQFMISAMSSWQPSLCQTVSSTFAFSTNPDSVARAQLLETIPGSPQLIYSGYPIASAELQTAEERTLLGKTSLEYAPVGISSMVVAYNAEFPNGRPGALNLTPRLMAKLLTQSYTFTVPGTSNFPVESIAHLSASARSYNYFNLDPDFQQANPSNWELYSQQNPSLVLPGPSAADGIKQVWRWILADSDARAFLDGTPDPWGMTINPYYLPKTPANLIPWYYDADKNFLPTPTTREVGQVALDGSPLKLSTVALDTFPKDDGSQVPFVLSPRTGGSRYDSIQFAPYAIDYLTAARQTFRADPNSRTYWDAARVNDAGELGAYISQGVQDAGARFMISVMDSANAARYGLTTASLMPSNSRTPVSSTTDTMTAALSALSPTSLDSILQVDPAKVTGAAYPLTMVTYASVNLSKSTPASRQTIAKMIQQVTTTGQVPGTALGQLPVGYVPLTPTLASAAAASAVKIQTWTPPATSTGSKPSANSNNNVFQQEYSGDGLVDPTEVTGADPTVTSGVDALTDERTPTSSSGPLNSGLAVALIVGLLGFLVAPFILRGRGLL